MNEKWSILITTSFIISLFNYRENFEYSIQAILIQYVVVYFLSFYLYNIYHIRKVFLEHYRDSNRTKTTLAEGHYIHKDVGKAIFQEELKNLVNDIKEENKKLSEVKNDDKNYEMKGVYGPGDKMWEVGRESALFLGGGRAVFLQLAHPFVAVGVKHHSKVADDIQKRFYNTFYHVFRLTFGEMEIAEKSAKQVRSIHDKVFGKIDKSSYAENALYSANHEGAIIWVWATLTETSVFLFQMIVRKLSKEEVENYYQDQKKFVRYFGVSPNVLPPSWDSFMEYNRKMWNSEMITVCETARESEKSLFQPKKITSKISSILLRKHTFTMLPQTITSQYLGHPVSSFDYLNFYLSFAAFRTVYHFTPPSFRYLGSYVEAERRIAGKDVFSSKINKLACTICNWFLNNVVMDPSQNLKDWNDSKIKNLDSTLFKID